MILGETETKIDHKLLAKTDDEAIIATSSILKNQSAGNESPFGLAIDHQQSFSFLRWDLNAGRARSVEAHSVFGLIVAFWRWNVLGHVPATHWCGGVTQCRGPANRNRSACRRTVTCKVTMRQERCERIVRRYRPFPPDARTADPIVAWRVRVRGCVGVRPVG